MSIMIWSALDLHHVVVLEAGQCYPGDVFSAMDNSVKSFPTQRTVICIPASDASGKHSLCDGIERFL